MDYSYSKTNDGAGSAEEYEFHSIDVISKILISMLLFGCLLLLLNELSDFMQLLLLGRSYTAEEGAINDRRVQFLAIGLSGTILLTVPVFGFWIVRAHRNLPALGAERLDVKPGWAVGWFFIPIANLWKPFASMRTLWKASHNGPQWQLEDVPFWLAIWWIGWILSNLMNRILMTMVRRAGSIEDWVAATQLSMAIDGVMLVVHLLAALMVYRIWRAQDAQLAAREAAATSPPPPTLRDALPTGRSGG
jgi:hypothetical protein